MTKMIERKPVETKRKVPGKMSTVALNRSSSDQKGSYLKGCKSACNGQINAPVEESISGLGDKLDALGHHGQQGEGRPHLVLVHQLRHDGVGDLLNGPVEGVEHANEEEVDE